MSVLVGASFVEQAMGPLRTAAANFCAGKVREGLSAIAPPNLLAAISRASKEVARKVGVRPKDVEAMLPWAELKPTLNALDENLRGAFEVWDKEGHRLGGFLAGVAEVTVEADRGDDAGFYLGRLADKLSRDPNLSAPLDALSADVTRWEQILERCGPLLDDGPRLRRAYLRKVAIRAFAATVLVAIAAIAATHTLRLRDARGRVDEKLRAEDPCAVGDIAPEDQERATPEQLSSIEESEKACVAARERAAVEEACRALAANAVSGTLGDEDFALLGEWAPLVRRASKGELEIADLAATPTFPCEDAGAPAALWKTIAEAASKKASLWAAPGPISPTLLKMLKTSEHALDDKSRITLVTQAESIAERAVLRGNQDDIDRSKVLCDLHESLGLEKAKWCTALDVALSRSAPKPR